MSSHIQIDDKIDSNKREDINRDDEERLISNKSNKSIFDLNEVGKIGNISNNGYLNDDDDDDDDNNNNDDEHTDEENLIKKVFDLSLNNNEIIKSSSAIGNNTSIVNKSSPACSVSSSSLSSSTSVSPKFNKRNMMCVEGIDFLGLGAQNNDNSYDDQNTTITINEDDIIDKHVQLRNIFIREFYEKLTCKIDKSQNSFTILADGFNIKLSKSLQRKLVNLYELLKQKSIYSKTDEEVEDGGKIHDESNEFETVNDLDDVIKISTSTNYANLISNTIKNKEYKCKIFRLLRSIAERVLIDSIDLCDQYSNQIQQYEQQKQILATNIGASGAASSALQTPTSLNNNPINRLWSEIRNRGCQFLGPQMQEDVLKLILHALEVVTRLSRKVLVLYVVHMLKKHYPKASKTSVGHVVQLLYRAGCFKVEKRENDTSLMELKKEFCKYQALRRKHDEQIILIALESGIRMSPEQWSQKLFGDASHKSEMQSIIDTLQSQITIEKLISDFYEKINSINSCSQISAINSLYEKIKDDFDYFAAINFEKKQVQQTQIMPMKRNSIVSSIQNSDHGLSVNLGSGTESLASDDEISNFDSNDFYDDLSDYKHQEQEQTKIVWSLISECLKRAINVLITHIEYTSSMNSVMSNNSSLNAGAAFKPITNQRLPVGLNQMFGANSLITNPFKNSANDLLPQSTSPMTSMVHTSNISSNNYLNSKQYKSSISSEACGYSSSLRSNIQQPNSNLIMQMGPVNNMNNQAKNNLNKLNYATNNQKHYMPRNNLFLNQNQIQMQTNFNQLFDVNDELSGYPSFKSSNSLKSNNGFSNTRNNNYDNNNKNKMNPFQDNNYYESVDQNLVNSFPDFEPKDQHHFNSKNRSSIMNPNMNTNYIYQSMQPSLSSSTKPTFKNNNFNLK